MTLFLLVTSYKLSGASLWFDELVEFYYSKSFYSQFPWESKPVDMFTRCRSTFQPPLYNVLMFFWLQLGTSEWWIRFSGVLLGLVGAIGTYKSVNSLTDSPALSAVSIIPYAFISRQHYYWQEFAEYALLLAIIPWLTYYFIRLIQTKTAKSILHFTIFAVLTVYSQYGGAFIVLTMGIISVVIILFNKNKKTIYNMIIIYALTGLISVIPLYYFFLKHQMAQQNREIIIFSKREALKEFFPKFFDVFKWNMIGYSDPSEDILLSIFLIFVIGFSLFYLIKGKNNKVKALFLCNSLTYLFYFTSIKLNIYAYGEFGNRYNLFFIPVWFIYIYSFCAQFIRYIHSKQNYIFVSNFLTGVLAIVLIAFSISGWAVIRNGYVKEDARGVVKAWVDKKCYESYTFVYYAAPYGTLYYLDQNGDYYNKYADRIYFQAWDRNKTIDQYKVTIDEAYPTGLPDDLFIIAYHYRNDLDTLADAFIREGFTREDIFTSTGAKLLHLHRN